MKPLVDQKEIENGNPDPRNRGALLFSQFRKFLQQMRSAEEATHTAMLNQMRTSVSFFIVAMDCCCCHQQ
jgi:hypothetical protein